MTGSYIALDIELSAIKNFLDHALQESKDEIEQAVISVDIWRLFASRLLYYGVALFLAIAALSSMVQDIISVLSPGISRATASIVTLCIAAVSVLVLCVIDIRSKVQY